MCFWLPVTRKGTFAQLYVFRFTKGQPQRVLQFMAPVFTLTHHMLVWYAAWRVRPGVKFFDYALLGDDIVIADPVVAKSYLEVMEECEVTISKEKSLISNVSALEFAKRFMVHKVTLYFSLVSLRVLRTLSSLLEFPLSCFRSCESICCVRTGYAVDLRRSTHVKVFRHLNVGSAIIS